MLLFLFHLLSPLSIQCQNSTTTLETTTETTTTPTVNGTTTAACIDNPDTDCASFKDYCTNDKYIPLLKAFCPVTCNFCPGATTGPPTTANPNCFDSSSKYKQVQ